jgi:N-acetylmuramic acid 6-phosphate etherase
MRRSMRRASWARLSTERANPASRALDRMTAVEIARLMNREDQAAVRAIRRALPAIGRAVDLIVTALANRGRLFFIGAGTSGRLGVLEAAECPPTFGTSPRLVQAIMAGGRSSVFRSREGAEDDASAAARAVRARVRRRDVVVGVSASGVTPFVRSGLAQARKLGARTVLVVCNPRPARGVGDVVITLAPGPEVLAGSTRLKAGTVTKLVLNTLTTASMARRGRVYGNLMVDLQPRSAKLRARATRLVQQLGGVSAPAAARALRAAGGHVRLAIVMAHTGLRDAPARRLLREAAGSLRVALERHSARQAVAHSGNRRRASRYVRRENRL